MYQIQKDWADFKSSIIENNYLVRYVKTREGYDVISAEAGLMWIANLCLPDDILDFETNYKEDLKKPIVGFSKDGIQVVTSIPAIDSTMACFCPSVAGELSVDTPYVDYDIADSYVQMAGINIQITGAELWDKLFFQVGMIVGGNFIVFSDYGDKKLITPNWDFDFLSPLRSAGIPQGLKLRIAMVFNNPETTNKPKLSVMYHLWRPYA
jgi:hypothetical protein